MPYRVSSQKSRSESWSGSPKNCTCPLSPRRQTRSLWSETAANTECRNSPESNSPEGTTVKECERELILQTLSLTNQNKTRAAELLGISLKTLHNKLKSLYLFTASMTAYCVYRV
jgi:DNA-binding NtrC family response regulator